MILSAPSRCERLLLCQLEERNENAPKKPLEGPGTIDRPA